MAELPGPGRAGEAGQPGHSRRPGLKTAALLAVIVLSCGALKLGAEDSSLMFLNLTLATAEAGAGKSSARIAGGLRLLADDPASYAVYQVLEKEIRALGASIGNHADMLSYYRFEDAMLGTVIDEQQRIRELAVEDSDGILSGQDHEFIEEEMARLYDQILSSLSQAEFNRVRVFAPLSSSPALAAMLRSPGHYRLGDIDGLLDFLIGERVLVGSRMRGLEFEIQGKEVERENATRSLGQGDTDMAAESVALQRENLLILANLLMLPRQG